MDIIENLQRQIRNRIIYQSHSLDCDPASRRGRKELGSVYCVLFVSISRLAECGEEKLGLIREVEGATWS